MRLLRLPATAFLLVLSGCVGDPVSYVVFDGERYSGGPSAGYRIESQDVLAIGDATEVQAAVRGTTVYSLQGVDPQDVVVMESDGTDEATYFILFRNGVLSEDGTEDGVFVAVPELCPYGESPPERVCG